MAVILLKLIFSVMSTLSNLVTRLIFNAAALVFVQMIQALKVPGERSQRILEQVKNMITTCLEYLVDLVVEVISTVFASIFDLVKEGVLSSSSGLIGAMAALVEQSRTSLHDAMQAIPEVLEAFTETVGKIVSDCWNNCNEALAYVQENVLK